VDNPKELRNLAGWLAAPVLPKRVEPLPIRLVG
jgi:hypothetical protein